ncbi:hypothetical protein JKP88DRAFT_352317 [Tribonema minus]|uniref:Uncharacterized protein n=1 Tax=Tribonema minus TaxID=303371 RepID=A0A836CN91_9STRA|nr:hypothetical protein JKP88DRAFT_352317 [Tribonema minus]
MASAYVLCMLTGLLYYYQWTPADLLVYSSLRVADMVFIHATTACDVYVALRLADRLNAVCFCSIVAVIVYIYYSGLSRCEVWHASTHILGNVAHVLMYSDLSGHASKAASVYRQFRGRAWRTERRLL